MIDIEMEGRIAAIWANVLEVTHPIRPEDNFFALGGDSLAATIVLFQINEQLGVELAPASLLEAASLAEFCTSIEATRICAST